MTPPDDTKLVLQEWTAFTTVHARLKQRLMRAALQEYWVKHLLGGKS